MVSPQWKPHPVPLRLFSRAFEHCSCCPGNVFSSYELAVFSSIVHHLQFAFNLLFNLMIKGDIDLICCHVYTVLSMLNIVKFQTECECEYHLQVQSQKAQFAKLPVLPHQTDLRLFTHAHKQARVP